MTASAIALLANGAGYVALSLDSQLMTYREAADPSERKLPVSGQGGDAAARWLEGQTSCRVKGPPFSHLSGLGPYSIRMFVHPLSPSSERIAFSGVSNSVPLLPYRLASAENLP
jgi:hypothetical protein